MQRGARGTVQPDVLPEGGGREQDPGRGQEQQPQGASPTTRNMTYFYIVARWKK